MRNTNILPFQDYFVLKNDYTDSLHIVTFGSGEKNCGIKIHVTEIHVLSSWPTRIPSLMRYCFEMLVKFVLCKELVYVMSFYSDWIVFKNVFCTNWASIFNKETWI